MLHKFLVILSITLTIMTNASCAKLKRVDKSNLNSMAMNLNQTRTPAFIGRGITLNANGVGSQTACTTCAK